MARVARGGGRKLRHSTSFIQNSAASILEENLTLAVVGVKAINLTLFLCMV